MINAIITSSGILLLVTIIYIVIIFIYAVVSYHSYVPLILGAKNGGVIDSCDSMFTCIPKFLLSGYLGQYKFTENYTTVFLDTFYFIIVSILFVNIITSIMVDTFASNFFFENLNLINLFFF